jgi:hypothetical protein
VILVAPWYGYLLSLASGQTWFFGSQPIHVEFFKRDYTPQLHPFNPSTARFGPQYNIEETLIISNDYVEVEDLNRLGHNHIEKNGYIFLDPRLSSVRTCEMMFST